MKFDNSQSSSMPEPVFEVSIPDFGGPMDLLVYLVRKRELDIAYISISALATDFLNWLERIENPDLDQVGDFILLAATLLEFKVGDLLAGPEPDITEAEMGEAYREHSIAELLALRTNAQRLAELEERQSNLFERGGVHIAGLEAELSGEMLADVSIYDIAVAFRNLIYKLPPEPTHIVEQVPFTLEGQMAFIMSFFKSGKRVAFERLAEALETRLAVVMTFLAMLELLRLRRIAVRQTETFGPLWLVERNVSLENKPKVDIQ